HGCFFFSSRRRHTRFSRDWSSDVCSSDLPLLVIHGRDDAVVSARNGQAAAAQWATALGAAQGESRIVQRGTRKAMTVTDFRRSQIGRASCRERVEISAVAAALKQQR